MNRPPKVRTDYHDLSSHDDDFHLILQRWLKPSVWLMLGFLIGILCNRLFFATQQNSSVAYAIEEAPTYSLQMSAFSEQSTPIHHS